MFDSVVTSNRSTSPMHKAVSSETTTESSGGASVKVAKNTVSYVCLKPGCDEQFEVWKDARNHMVLQCKVRYNIKESRRIAQARHSTPSVTVDPLDPFKGKLKVETVPTEQELVAKIKQFFENPNPKGDSLGLFLKREYGNFTFSTFGYGKLYDFCKKIGLYT